MKRFSDSKGDDSGKTHHNFNCVKYDYELDQHTSTTMPLGYYSFSVLLESVAKKLSYCSCDSVSLACSAV